MRPVPTSRSPRAALLTAAAAALLVACGSDSGTETPSDAGTAATPATSEPAASPSDTASAPSSTEAASDLEGDAPSPY